VAEPEPAPAPVSKPRTIETPKISEPVSAPAPKAPVKSEPAPSAPAPAPAISNDDFWLALVAAVRRDRKLISGWLEAGALTRVDDKTVQIGFPPEQAFSKDFLEQGHREFLTEAASTILGRNVRISLEVRDGVVATAIAQPKPEPKLDPMEEFKRDPLIRKALEIFRAEVQPA
jgi:DNA polymerase-3 subunit gamma/tau